MPGMHSMTPELIEERDDLLFGVRRSARYHAHRVRFFDQIGKAVRILAAVAGIGTITTLLASIGDWATHGLAASVAFFSALDVVLDFAAKARLHTDLYRRFIDLEKRIVGSRAGMNQDLLAELTNARLSIEQEEPPILTILDCICHNELVKAMDCNDGELVRLTFAQRLLADVLDWKPHCICKQQPV